MKPFPRDAGLPFPDRITSKQPHSWATLVPDRSPQFKVHNDQGKARAALTCHFRDCAVALYELVEGAWCKREEYARGVCSTCGGNRYLQQADFHDPRPSYAQPQLCYSCRRITPDAT